MNGRIPSLTDPVRQLLDEHEIFMEALYALAEAMSTVPAGASTCPPDVYETIERVWSSVNEHLNVHFVKEEEIFFPHIEKLIPGSRVKFQFLHVDHDRLRENFEDFTEALQNYRAVGGTARGVSDIRKLSAEMIRWFYFHIIAEDAVYFDIAEQTMSPEESKELLGRMRLLEGRLREQVGG
jgi:hemerythrin-like domain-containing protein